MKSYKVRFTWQQGVACAVSSISATNRVDDWPCRRYSLIEVSLGAVNQLEATISHSSALNAARSARRAGVNTQTI
jgi:hypothetical protein